MASMRRNLASMSVLSKFFKLVFNGRVFVEGVSENGFKATSIALRSSLIPLRFTAIVGYGMPNSQNAHVYFEPALKRQIHHV